MEAPQEYVDAFSAFLSETLQELARAGDPLLGSIERVEGYGPIGSVIQDQHGTDVDLKAAPVGATLSVAASEVLRTDEWAFVRMVSSASIEFREEFHASFYGTMATVTNATGNTLDAGGKLTFDKYYELMKRISRSLDENDELSPLTIAASPDTARNVQSVISSFTPEQVHKLQSLFESQRNELLVRKNELLTRRRNRRLSRHR